MLRAYPCAVVVVLAGCVDGFRGSNVQVDFSFATPAQAPPSLAMPKPTQLPTNTHYLLVAITEEADREHTFVLQQFEIHPIVDPGSPCFIDAGEHARFPGLHVTRYRAKIEEVTGITDLANPPPGASETDKIDAATALQRQGNVAALAGDTGIKVVTSASAGGYPTVDSDCDGTGLPPPQCIDDDDNLRRLEHCRVAWRADPALYEGTDRVLTAPLNGTTFGFVVGLNPINMAPLGGAQFFVDEALGGVDEYAIYYRVDGVEDDLGTQILLGRPMSATRGVRHVHMTSAVNAMISADLAIFENIGEDDTHF